MPAVVAVLATTFRECIDLWRDAIDAADVGIGEVSASSTPGHCNEANPH